MNTKLGRRVLLAVCLLRPTLHAAEGSLNFDGVDDFVEVPNFQSLGISTEVTIEFWAKTETVKQQSAFMLDPDNIANRCSGHISYTNGNTYWDFGDISSGGRVFLANPANTLGNWTHYALVASQTGNFMKIYVNGVQVASGSSFNAFETATACALRIGGTTGFFLDGSLDEFRVWNVARSQADIQGNLAGPLTGSEPGLRLYFKFDEGSGLSAVNSAIATGAAYNGTLTNGPAWSTLVRSTHTVTNTGDTGPGSLRQTLADAAAAGGAAVITFDAALSGQTITLGSEIVINDPDGITLDAGNLPGGLTIDGGPGSNRIFSLSTGRTAALRGLTLTGGNGSGATSSGSGGAILNNGELTLTRCTLSGNSGNFGGGVLNFGTATVDACTFVGNSATTVGGGLSSQGTLTVTRSTFSGNMATDPGGEATGGGALNFAVSASPSLLENCTITGNSAPDSGGTGGGIRRGGGTVTIKNCIVAQNTAATAGTGNLSGSITTTGANLTSGDPVLSPLGNYGGPTQTRPPLAGSPAMDAAVGSTFTTDQRGVAIAGLPEIGAVEIGSRVSTGADELDTPSGTAISLREAVRDCPDGGLVDFSTALSGGICTLGSEIVLSKSVSIDASSLAAGITLQKGGSTSVRSRIFYVNSGQNAALRDLTMTGGYLRTGADPGFGGAIFSKGTLTLTRCTLSGNSANAGGAIMGWAGTLTLTQCTLSGNTAGSGGAVHSNGAIMALTHCTLTGNAATQNGGAISNNFGHVTLTHCTVSGNTALAGWGGGISTLSDARIETVVRHSIIAGNAGSDVDFLSDPLSDPLNTFTSLGGNLIGTGNATDDFNQSGDTINHTAVTAKLAPLGNYGGPTQTRPPLAGSPAMDGAVGSTFTTDQRGYSVAGVADIGAVEGGVFVNTTADELDTPGGTNVSLREAVRDCPPGGWIGFRAGLSGQTITLTLGSEIVLTKSATIDAGIVPGTVTVNGGPGDNRIFSVNAGQTVAMSGLTLTGGNGGGPTNFGGAILNSGTLSLGYCNLVGNTIGTAGAGGAIYSADTLSLSQCSLSGNFAGFSGAIYSAGTASLTQCTLSGNTSQLVGGAISSGSGPLTLTQCTLSGNSAGQHGGAIAVVGPVTLTQCTISGNFASAQGGAIWNTSGSSSLTLNHSIVAGNTANLGGPNIDGSFTGSNNITTGDPLLAPLGNYGGLTKTMAQLPGSPARNAATGSTITSDQRGFPVVGTPDIGAYEAGTFTNFDAWVWETLPASATAPQHAATYDYDGDTAPLLLEYAGQFSGTLPDGASPMPFTRNPAGTLATLVMPYRPGAADLLYTIERSTTLSGVWTPILSVNGATSTDVFHVGGVARIGSDVTTITFTDSFITGQPQVFYRLQVARQ